MRPSATVPTAKEVILWTLALLISIAVVVLTVRVLLAIFAGVLLAIVLRAAASFVTKHTHLRYGLNLTIIVLMLLAAVVVGIVLLVPRLEEQFDKFREAIPSALQTVANTLGLQGSLRDTLGNASSLKDINMEKVATGAASTVGATFDALAGLVICIFVAIYGAAAPNSYSRVLLAIVPARSRTLTKNIVKAAVGNLERWLLGRLVAMVFVGVASGIAFLLLKVPLAIPLAILAGLLTFVEYIGAIASAAPAVLLAFGQSPLTALWVAVVFTALHVIEGYWLTPMLARTAVHFPSAVTLVGQAVFGTLVGPLGLTFSTPLLVVCVSAAKEWRDNASSNSDSAALEEQ